MAAALDVATLDPKIIAAGLLADIRLSGLLYTLVRSGGRNIYVNNETCAYPVGESSGKRAICDAITKRYTLAYHPDDLTIVGGMAFAQYDNAISDIKKTRSLGPLQKYLSKNTSDIDMVWWPRILDNMPGSNEEIVVISSPAIKKHVEQFKNNVQSIFQDAKYVDLIKQFIPNLKLLEIEVAQTLTVQAGVIHIVIYFNITYNNDARAKLEMCDISIHDGGSSQIQLGPQGRPILVPMETDPMYVSQTHHQIKTLPITPEIRVNVPIMLKLIDQQLLAFSNLLEKKVEKCLINYNRIRYILLLLIPRNAVRSALLHMFNIDNVNYIITNTEMALTQIINMKCGNDTGPLCVLLHRLQQEKQADTMMQLQLQHIVNEQRVAKKISPHKPFPTLAAPMASKSVKRQLVFPENKPTITESLAAKTCTLPDKMHFPYGRKITIVFDDQHKKDVIERLPNLCTYYHIVQNKHDEIKDLIPKNATLKNLKQNVRFELEQIFKIIDKIYNGTYNDTTQKSIDSMVQRVDKMLGSPVQNQQQLTRKNNKANNNQRSKQINNVRKQLQEIMIETQNRETTLNSNTSESSTPFYTPRSNISRSRGGRKTRRRH
jgi:hypothetical protein